MPEDEILKTKADKEWLKLRTPMTAARYERKNGEYDLEMIEFFPF